MRILLTAFGSRGDVEPMLALGLGLRDRGHDVTVGAAPNYRQWVEELGLTFHEIGGDFQPWLQKQSARNPFSVLGSLAAYVRDAMPLCFEQTHAAVRESDLVVTTMHLAAHSASQAVGIPCRTVLYTPQLLPSRFHPPAAIPPQNLPGGLNRTLWWAMAWGFDSLFKKGVNRQRDLLGLDPIGGFLEYAHGAKPIVASDAELAAIPPDVANGAIQTGAFVMSASGSLDPAIEEFLGDGTPPIYLGFGSMPDKAPQETVRLMVEGASPTGKRAILCGGWAGLGGIELPREILGVPDAPHSLLFPRVAVIVHHGGAGTTATALRAGVPQIVVPHLGDQFFHARRVTDIGVGLCISRRRLTALRLTSAIQEVLADPEMETKARKIADDLRDVDGVGNAIEALMTDRGAGNPRAAHLSHH